ncbi:MAG TPA: DUF5671 domain-containing protein [Thermodesulfobacteriota bacterium]|nr:DUF5671 domain-containing protein [Candidatus Paceibacterota bacterium]HVY55850.1 DUF5671 domain-containing protein [Thermodesulfobacteriota bacterium]
MPNKTTAKDFFIYLASFAGLYVSVVSLVSLLFAIINRAFPDMLNSYYYATDFYSGPIRAAIACLLIVFPLYLVIASYIDKYVRANPEKKDIAVRKWLTYLTLFITGVAVVIDLVVLVNTFLGGEITSRFIWKIVSVLVVSGAVFSYYFYDLKKTFAADAPKKTLLIISLASLLVFGSLVTGFVLVGSPMQARAARFDERRVNDLTSIQWQIVNYWQQKGALPTDIASLNDPISSFMVPVDPETGTAYGYQKTGAVSFKVCADFNLKSGAASINKYAADYGMSAAASGSNNWAHGMGTACFDRNIDPDLYPVRAKGAI